MISKEECLEKVLSGGRFGGEEALFLMKEGDLVALGRMANLARDRKSPSGVVTFLIDRNINYTNICSSRCRFCAFYRRAGSPEAFLLTQEEIFERIEEALALGATQVMLQGGLHPGLKLPFFVSLLSRIKSKYPVTLHSFSPPEVVHMAETSGFSVKETLRALKEAGLDSLPGGGAEVLVDRVRKEVSPHKISSREWLNVMEAAHELGMKTTATMMMGSIETLEERLIHLAKIRNLQDRTGGFRAFIPWTYQPGHTELGGKSAGPIDYLKTLAVSRLFLDNIDHVQGSWVTQGKEIGQICLHLGEDDLGSIMIEENVVRATGVSFKISEEEMVDLIRRAGRIPAKRNTEYEIVRRYGECGGELSCEA